MSAAGSTATGAAEKAAVINRLRRAHGQLAGVTGGIGSWQTMGGPTMMGSS